MSIFAKLKTGTPVYYHRLNGDTVPAVVLGVNEPKRKVQIKGDFRDGTKQVWVKPCRLEVQRQ